MNKIILKKRYCQNIHKYPPNTWSCVHSMWYLQLWQYLLGFFFCFLYYKFCVNPWKKGSDFQATAPNWKWNMVMNTARCEGNCLQNFLQSSAACSLLKKLPVGACHPSGTQHYVYSFLTKAHALSHRHTTLVNFVEQTWKFTNGKIWPFMETTMDQCWWHTPGRNSAWLFLSSSYLIAVWL